PGMPEPRPMYEVFVYSPRVEGVHLRGGPVARGGIRWSDRREDFRTEILGLMKAQMVKNAVIVPVGAKGGFVVKQPPDDRRSLPAEVKACYQLFINGLLDLTDNLRDGQLDPPVRTVRRDGDDAYLVVAADRGTARFSDTANSLAEARDFWLGDAFASGGSEGYDHKKMGITARGAWESIKRHFLELGQDCQREAFSVAGIGSMAGDVFGNGMLLSRSARLVAAFDHATIFLDPDPDPIASFSERQRLFAAVGTWSDYNPALISHGGGVFARSAKSIELTEPACACLGIESNGSGLRMPPNELISSILRAPVDLFWCGGIGTYVKASSEDQRAAGDRDNDAVRVDAADLRCRVVGEGANLAFTQAARIEFAAAGGRINTDFIDNSGGVDCSDREVNIKILLRGWQSRGLLDAAARRALLERMTDEVAGQVLHGNFEQAQALSLNTNHAVHRLAEHAALMRAMEQAGRLDRALEFLPDDSTLGQRKSEGRGLTHPELAVLMAYTMIDLTSSLLASDLPDDPFFNRWLVAYFPTPLREQAGPLAEHPLRREIVCTQVALEMLHRADITFIHRVREVTGASADQVVRATLGARRIFELDALWQQVSKLPAAVPAATRMKMFAEIVRLAERTTRWLLRHQRADLRDSSIPERYASDVEAVRGQLGEAVVSGHRRMLTAARRDYERHGVETELARRIAQLGALYSALDISDASRETGIDLAVVSRVYYQLGSQLELFWLREQMAQLPRKHDWHEISRTSLFDDSFNDQRQLTIRVLADYGRLRSGQTLVDRWLDRHRAATEKIRGMLNELKAVRQLDLVMIGVVVREIERLAVGESD
ncbi:MAG: NAD-glutamate dehydrogenase, partial [Gammaproteobacteria bacterium]|nr:NAD-glutamate dehydrogenase [Gammaproteobacteria bacterium]